MKKLLLFVAFVSLIVSHTMHCAESKQDITNPMNAAWFYDKDNPYYEANMMLQEKSGSKLKKNIRNC